MTTGSLTARVLAEVAPHVPPLACCRAALVEGMCATTAEGDLVTTRLVAARAALAALHHSGAEAHVERLNTPRRHRYRVVGRPAQGIATVQPCCLRSRLRGAFLVSGSVSQPSAALHLEIGCQSPVGADSIVAWLATLEIAARTAPARSGWRVLITDSAGIGDVLSSVGAQGARLAFEEGRVLREVGGTVNRQLNAETANLRRTVGAGLAQLAAIDAIESAGGLDGLPPALREAAALRRRHPSEPLDRVAELAGCSRSAMADRFRRLVAAAERANGAGC